MRADDAEAEAKRRRATLAVPRRLAKPGELCLSPASLKSVPGDLRLVLPSPNGSTLSLSTGDRPTLAGCLRNARAVAAFARRFGDNVAVIPAGERWRDGSLRPAIEDWLGAGAIVDALDLPLSAEAALARDSFRASRPRIRQLLNDSLSGQELIESGWSDDVAIAAEVDVSPNVAQLLQGGYRAVAP
jgi:2-phosphosulfolactate phosphatase